LFAIYQLIQFPVTVSESWPRYQGHDIIQHQISRKWYWKT